jgi:DNA-binding SARP family transcriptional activator
VKGIAGEQMAADCAERMRKAIALYEGNLLEGWYQDWCLYHRERLENAYLAMLDKLMAYCELHEEFEAGISYGERLLLQDRARERTYCRLMRLRYFGGDRAGALREFQRCEVALKEELGVAPARQTIELRERICSDGLNKQEVPFPRTAPRKANPAMENEEQGSSLFKGLRRLRSVLMKIQRRVELDLREVNSILDAQPDSSVNEKR